MGKKITFSTKDFDKLFPFHILIGEDLRIISKGKSLNKINESPILSDFLASFAIKRPYLEQPTFEDLRNIGSQLVILETLDKQRIVLRGQFEILNFNQKENLLFLGSPWFYSVDNLQELGLTLHDFAAHDPLIDLLHVLRTQEIATEEIKELLGTVNDQKKKFATANQRMEVLQNLFNHLTDALIICFEDGQFFYINKAASNQLGILLKEVEKYNIRNIKNSFQLPDSWENYIFSLKNGKNPIIESESINQLTGESISVEITARYIQIGGVGYIVASSRDITMRKAYEVKLKKQEEKYRNIIANMNLGLLEVDKDQYIIFANQSFCEMSGYTLTELIGKNAPELFLWTSADKVVLDQKTAARQKGELDSYEMAMKNKKGELRWWLISGAPNYNDKNELIGTIGIHLDITAQKKLEMDLERAKSKAEDASKAKEAFLASMSHEIRTPLNAIVGMIRELGREKLTLAQSNYVKNTELATNHLLSIVNNVLDISKIEANELQLESHDFSLEALIANVKSILYARTLDKKLNFEVEIDENLRPALIGDSTRIRQIIINLLGNAIKFTEKGTVALNCKVLYSNNYFQKILLRISDTGIGIDEKFLQTIFNKFSQEDKTISRKYGGTGLGMPITYELVQLMGGSLNVMSTKSIGTTIDVELTLPIGDISRISKENNEIYKNCLEGRKVLLVEDNEMNRFIATQSLKHFGCSIVEANNGLEAIKLLEKDNFDIILMDIQMPEMGGMEATEHIRKKMQIPTPIIALTANAMKKDIDSYLGIGMNYYVTKPFEEAHLANSIQRLLMINEAETLAVVPKNGIERPAETASKQTFSLVKLNEISRGDINFVNKMIHIFIDNGAKSMQEMKAAFQQKDYLMVSKIAHRLKPSIDNLDIIEIKDIIRHIENNGKSENPNVHLMDTYIEKVDSTLHEVISGLQQLVD